MARARIELTCTDCGKKFVHIHTCRNSREAASYEVWAKENITCCPDCLAAGRKAEQAVAVENYLASFAGEFCFPEITGVSDKQIAYAKSLRDRFIADELAHYHVDIPRFVMMAEKLHLNNCGEADKENLRAAAAKEGKTLEDWFADYRTSYLKRNAHLVCPADVTKLEAIIAESNASKIIDALR